VFSAQNVTLGILLLSLNFFIHSDDYVNPCDYADVTLMIIFIVLNITKLKFIAVCNV